MINKIETLNPLANAEQSTKETPRAQNGEGFMEILQKTLEEVNDLQIKGDRALSEIATGQVKDLHQAAIAIDKAEISMKVMLEVRNKALNAYKEILRTQL